MPLFNRLHDNHFSLSTCEDVRAICQPLFTTTSIHYFHYARVFPDGHSMVLLTHPELHRFFWQGNYDKDVFQNYQFEGWFIYKTSGCDLIHKTANYFNVDNWLLRVKHKKDYIESCGFGTPSSCGEITDFYLNNQNMLEAFCIYFKEIAKSLIDKSKKNLLYTQGLDFSSVFGKNKIIETKPYDILKGIIVDKKCLFETPLDDIVGITKIELLILHYVSCGLSAKMIGKVLNISPRTAEIHLAHIKDKWHVKNKSEMIKLYLTLFNGKPPSIEVIHHIFQEKDD